jgi:hypothetical protein
VDASHAEPVSRRGARDKLRLRGGQHFLQGEMTSIAISTLQPCGRFMELRA